MRRHTKWPYELLVDDLLILKQMRNKSILARTGCWHAWHDLSPQELCGERLLAVVHALGDTVDQRIQGLGLRHDL